MAERGEVATRAVERIGAGVFRVASLERGEVRRDPVPPFTTSTLQQEASRRLGFGVRRTMRLAQALYEGVDLDGSAQGLITYMRTDSVALSKSATAAARRIVRARFGGEYAVQYKETTAAAAAATTPGDPSTGWVQATRTNGDTTASQRITGLTEGTRSRGSGNCCPGTSAPRQAEVQRGAFAYLPARASRCRSRCPSASILAARSGCACSPVGVGCWYPYEAVRWRDATGMRGLSECEWKQ